MRKIGQQIQARNFKVKKEPLTVINFVHMPYSYSTKIMRIHFVVTGPEISGKKAKKLVQELEDRLKNFSHSWGTIKCSCSSLDEFFCAQVSQKKIIGVWHSVHFECSDSDKNENVRRENYNKMGYFISNEITKWTFSHYKTVLRIESCEKK